MRRRSGAPTARTDQEAVALPPGCPRLLTNPAPTGSAENGDNNWNLASCLFSGLGWRGVHRDDDIHIEADKLGSERTEALNLPFCVSVLDADALSFYPPEVPDLVGMPLFELRQRHRSCVLRNLFGAHFRLPAGRTRFATRRAQWQAQIPVCGACSYDFRPGSTANHNAYYRTLPSSPRRFE